MTVCISAVPAVTSLFSFPILLIWAPSLFPLTSLKVAEIWSLVYLFKGPVGFLDLFCCLMISLSFISALIFVTSSFYWFCFVVVFFQCRCKARLSVWCFPCFLRQDCFAVNFLLRAASAASHRFWLVMFSLSLVSRNSLVSLLVASVVC